PPTVLAADPLVPLVALLRFYSHRRDRTCLESGQADRFPRHLAKTIFASLDPPQRRIDHGDKLALPVTSAKMDTPIGLTRCPVGKVRLLNRAVGQFGHRLAGFPNDRILPG